MSHEAAASNWRRRRSAECEERGIATSTWNQILVAYAGDAPLQPASESSRAIPMFLPARSPALVVEVSSGASEDPDEC